MIPPARPAVPWRDAVRVWARVALQSFGGPAGQIAVVHRIVVEEKRWLGERRFLHALSYCMLLPGPEAQQLTTYVGWLLHGVRGGLVAGTLFILPGFVSILALSVLYAEYGHTAWVAGVFFGLKPAVIAIVLAAVTRLRRGALRGRGGLGLAAGAFAAIFCFGIPFPLVVLAAGLLGLMLPGAPVPDLEEPSVTVSRPSTAGAVRTTLFWLGVWLVPPALLLAGLGPGHVLVREAVFFSKAAVVTFGGAYAVLSYVAQQAVEAYQWLAPGQMLDGLGMAETTPGPLIQVVQFVGFMGAYSHPGGMEAVVTGVLGSVVTTWVTFAPCFLFVFVGAPYVEYLRSWRKLTSALAAITAAVAGVVVNLAVWFALHTLFGELERVGVGPASLLLPVPGSLDWRALLITLAAIVAVFRFRIGMMPVLGGSALLGLLLHRVF